MKQKLTSCLGCCGFDTWKIGLREPFSGGKFSIKGGRSGRKIHTVVRWWWWWWLCMLLLLLASAAVAAVSRDGGGGDEHATTLSAYLVVFDDMRYWCDLRTQCTT